ncbi:histone-lysine n-methyltransferase suvr3 [Quercus suber]|uniref:Histone-lysine n-methyltransferase suvr3 n=1 Tax=Quercus suber TaxID=58331 RepID=A0AAW0KSA2_QUESU
MRTKRQCQSWGSLGFSISASRLGVEPVSLVDELGHSVFGCDCERCDDDDPDGCPCFSEMDELDTGNECGSSCGCGLECENRLTQRGVSVGVGLWWRSVLGWCFGGVDWRWVSVDQCWVCVDRHWDCCGGAVVALGLLW